MKSACDGLYHRSHSKQCLTLRFVRLSKILRGGASCRFSLGNGGGGDPPCLVRLITSSGGVVGSHSLSWSYNKHSF